MFIGFLMLLGFSCSILKPKPKFQTTDSGLKYKFIEKYSGRMAPENGKLMSLRITYGSEDTVLFNSNDVPRKVMVLPMQSSAFPGDFYEMMEMMHLGDSAIFYIDAEPFFTKTAGYDHVPENAKGLDKLLFHVKIMKIQTEEDIEKEMEALQNELRDGETDRILEYVEKNNITTQPTETGLYVVVEEEGSGPRPQKGDKVKVHYTGMLLDGTRFDSSVDRGQPFEFPLGMGRVIKGWDEGIAMLNVGSKARLIIPSSLGYGERGAGKDIGPYAPLIFDVELLDIVK